MGIEQPKEPSEPDPPELAADEPAVQDNQEPEQGSEAKVSSSASKSASSASDGMTGSQASWNKSGSQDHAQNDLGKAPRSDLLVQQAVARARETALYQEATEKQKNTRRVQRDEDDAGILGLAGNLMNQEVVRETRPLALGTSLWNCGTDRGPCG